MKRLFVLMGLAVLPTARSERETQFDKGQNATLETGFGIIVIAVTVLLIDLMCRRCRRNVAENDRAEGDAKVIFVTDNGGVEHRYHQHVECRSLVNRKVTKLQGCKHCVALKRKM